jgi:preprotein translocase SecE subunit
MEDLNRHVVIAFVVFGLLSVWLLGQTLEWAFVSFSPASNMMLGGGFRLHSLLGAVGGIGLTWWLWNHAVARPFVQEVAVEVSRVTFPTMEDTRGSTVVVIVVSVLVALALSGFDLVWKFLTDSMLAL